jgi:HAD superfamily hydrolase (TIGR01509 family)
MASTYGGIEEVLKVLRANAVRLAVFTGKGRQTAGITLDRLHLSEYFDLVVSGNDVEEHKPSPEGIRLILDRFACPPAKVLMVGDSVSDIKAARAAGVPIASVVWDSYAKESVMSMGADFLFHSVKDFSRWIGEMFNHTGGQEH